MKSQKGLPVLPLLIAGSLLLILGLACNLPFEFAERIFQTPQTLTPTPPPTATPRPLPPVVVETDPLMGSSIGLQQPIRIYFNQKMDPASVEAAIKGELELSGTLEWPSPAVLVYTPDQPLQPNSKFEIIIGTGAKSANGLALQAQEEVQFFTPDSLKPTTFLPSPGSQGVDPSSAVVVTFNQPVVPLGGEPKDLPPAFTLTPSVPGRGEWINTSTYLFTPTEALAGGWQYSAALNPALTSTAGTSLDEEAIREWSFTTPSPALLDWAPASGESSVPLDASISLTFNQAVNQTSLETLLRVESFSGAEVEGAFRWAEDSREVTFTPDQPLDRNTTYAVLVPSEIKAAGGTLLGKEYTWQFQTVGEFQFLGTPGGQYYTTSVYEGVTLYFNSPINMENIQEQVKISPEVSWLNFYLGLSDTVLQVSGDFTPMTSYILTIDSSLSDRWNSSLRSPLRVNFSTDPLRPRLTLSEGTFDIFVSTGEQSLPAAASNISQASLNLGTIPVNDYAEVLNPENYSSLEEYYPADTRFWTESLNVPGDDSYLVDLPLDPQGRKLANGLYRFQLSSQELSYNPPPYLLTVSNLHVTMKYSPYNLLVWVVDLETNQPAAGVPVEIYNKAGQLRYSGNCDQQGVFQVEFESPRAPNSYPLYAIAGSPGGEKFGLSMTDWQAGVSPYRFNIQANYRLPEPTVHLYTDRPIYRPGQQVNYRVIKRLPDRGQYALPQEREIEVSVVTSQGEEESVRLPLSAYGTAHGSYQIPETANPGYFRIKTEHGFVLFQVAEYRKPEINLEISLENAEVLYPGEMNTSVAAEYYFDAPASEVPLTWSVRGNETGFSLPGYQVGQIGSSYLGYMGPFGGGRWGAPIASGEDISGPEGNWSLEFPLTVETDYDRDLALPAVYTLEVTVQDESGFSVSNRADLLVHPADFYIGVKPSSWIGQVDEEITVAVKTVDWQKQPDGPRSLQAVFHKINWNVEYNEYGGASFERQLERVSSTNFSTAANGEGAVAFTPPEPGTYQLDVSGGGARTEAIFWVGGPGTSAWPSTARDRIKLVADQESYQPGDTAEVFIPNPFPTGAQALITVERERLISQQTRRIESSGTTISLPLSDEEAPNIYLAVTLLGEDDQGRADYRQGYLALQVDPGAKRLHVDVVGDPKILEPRDEVEFTLQVTDQDGNPVQGAFSLAVVDQAVLALSDPYAEDIEEAFFSVRPLSVMMGLPLTNQAGRNLFVPGGMGGGGGDAVDTSIRDDFQDTGYWNAEIITNQDGKAVVTVTLPDNLTTWQAEARGITKDTKVGQATTEVITTKELLIRPVTPRFLVAGDHLILAAVVHNQTNQDRDVAVQLQGTGIQLDDPLQATQTVSIPAGSRTRVEWWTTVEDARMADVLFTAVSADLEDAVKPYQGPLPILRYTAPRTYGTAGLLTEPGQLLEIVSLPKTFLPEEGSLQVELSPSLAAAVLASLEALQEDELYSTVDSLSYFLPQVISYRTLQELGVDYPTLETRLDAVIASTTDELAAAQNEDGGWGWSPSSSSNVEITSYILFGLLQAQDAGIFIDQSMLQRARGYLLAALPSLEMLGEEWQYDQLAFQYFALTESGLDDLVGLMEDLAAYKSQLSPYGQALLALALETQSPGNSQAQSLFSDLQSSAVRTATGVHWENPQQCRCRMNSTTTTSALVTYALAKTNHSPEVLSDAVRYLISARRRSGIWGSYYETAWSVLALNEVLVRSGELESAFEFTADINGQEVIRGEAAGAAQLESATASVPVSDLYAEDPNGLVIEHGDGEGTLYYSSHLTVSQPAEEVSAFGTGMSLSRAYATLDEEDEQLFIQAGTTGTLVQVQLTLTLEHDSTFFALEDTFPAGAEILDTRLKTTAEATPDLQPTAPFREGWGWWFFNSPQVYDDHIRWSAERLPAGTYQLTYTISLTHPGEYQVLPARAWEVYFPENQAISDGDRFVIETEE